MGHPQAGCPGAKQPLQHEQRVRHLRVLSGLVGTQVPRVGLRSKAGGL